MDSGKNQKIVTSVKITSKFKLAFLKLKNRRVQIVLIAVLVIASLAGGYTYYSQKNKKTDTVVLHPEETISSQASTLAFRQGYKPAIEYLDYQINASKDKQVQASLHAEKAVLALNKKEFNDAKQFALKSESLSPTINSATLVAKSAEGAGDKVTAIKYYRLANTRMQQSNGPWIDDIIENENIIKNLGG